MWAIEPKGVGNKVGARAINSDWPLEAGETFKADVWDESLVLAEDKVSLRAETQAEEDKVLALENLEELKIAAVKAEEDKILITGTTPEAIDYRAEKAGQESK